MSEHTNEPWKVEYGPDQCITVIGNRSDVAWVFNPAAGLNDTSRSYAVDEANARRIVACVNACQGLDTADLETTGLVSAVGYQLIELTKRCDTLVASQAAKELGAILAIGDALTASDLPIIRRRLGEVIQATHSLIQACEQQQHAQDVDK